MIQIFADGQMVYDSRLEDYALEGLTVNGAVNKGGTAEIVLPINHPAYSSFTSYRTIVEIVRDGVTIFRGRALYPVDNYYNHRTIICEGELCFFQDAVARPYLYQADPATVFADVVGVYNSQVEEFKRFKVGTVTVTDANDYIRLETSAAELVLDTLNKLLERCGGYFVFTTDPADGARVINWYKTLGYRSNQTIEFGENLLDFARSGANTSLITAVLPYGAVNQETGERLTITSVNDGADYIVDESARALRGFIIRPVIWDDVTVPANLLRKAQEYLENNKYIITSLELTALDLSYLNKDIDQFQVGDTIRVISKPHSVDEDFILTEYSMDLLNPADSVVTLGKDKSSLTGADVAGDKNNQNELYRVKHNIKAEYTLNTEQAIAAAELELTTLIAQTSASILAEVSEKYVINDEMVAYVGTTMEQLSDSFNFVFNNLKATVDQNDADARLKFETIERYIRFIDGDIVLGSSDSAITLTLENDLIVFRKNGQQFGWWDGVDFHTGNIVVEVNERAQFGNFAFVPRTNGSLSFLKVGG